jgi:SH3-like domain-containing protein
MRGGFLPVCAALAALLTGPASWAQSGTSATTSTSMTSATHAHTAHTAPHKTTSAKAATATKTAPRHVPVVTPRHPGPPRRSTPTTAVASKRPLVRPAAKKTAVVQAAAPPATTAAAPAKPTPPPVPANVGTNTGLPLPRYASLKSDDVNMRVGPAERYPTIWTYQRRELPVRIEREFDIWRLVEDMDGVKGWVHQATLTGRRTFVITGTDDRTLRADASDTADAVATLKPGVVGRIRSCAAGNAWCQVQVQDYRGWLKRSDFWGADPTEAIGP